MRSLLLWIAMLPSIFVLGQTQLLESWKFSKTDPGAAFQKDFNDSEWLAVEIPHDWAAEGAFDFNNDLRFNTIIQNGETKPVYRTGRSGALPIVGVGWYRSHFNIKNLSKHYEILFDGAMSNAKVYVNGNYVGERPLGYISFYFDISKYLVKGDNVVAVRLENFNGQTRWYSGAGLYRKVSLIERNRVHIPTWGISVTTAEISSNKAKIAVEVNYIPAKNLEILNEILDAKGAIIYSEKKKVNGNTSGKFNTQFEIDAPKLWNLENPYLYTLKTTLIQHKKIIDSRTTTFGIREIRFELDGFYLNSSKIRFKGVNIHHDLGPTGAAFYPNLFERQLKKLKEMGVNAIRFSHNPPAIEALDLCDQYGFLVIDEAFDEWEIPKVENGYAKHFKKWAKTDLSDMILRDRNHPSIIMWSIGNEIMEQYYQDPNKVTKYLHDIVKSIDTTRATTCGFNNAIAALRSGMATTVDVAGFNYKPSSYHLFREEYPNLKFYASETGGALSVRDVYKFPVKFDSRRNKNGTSVKQPLYKNALPGNYEVTNVPWGYPAFREFASQDYNKDIMYGEFVWTGYDYLGEPAPYNKGTSRSSHFAPIDFVGLAKDKFYLYKSQWNTSEATLHFLPHWNWENKKDITFPVVCYTNYPKATLFVNGKSYGVKARKPITQASFLNDNFEMHASGGGSFDLMKAYSIVWDNVIYEAGEAKVVAFDENGKEKAVFTRRTAKKAHKINIIAEDQQVEKGEIAVYIISVLDVEGNWQPHYQENMKIEVSGAGKFLASGNGNPSNLQQLNLPERKFFNGKAVIYVKATKEGVIDINVSTKDFSEQHTSVRVK